MEREKVKVNTDKIMEEFHERREKEHFPLQFFLNEKYLDISHIAFGRLYQSWRRKNNKPILLITTEDYLEWMSEHENKDLSPLINYWKKIKERMQNGRSFSPLMLAMSVFLIIYPDRSDRISLMDKCGGSYEAMNRLKKQIKEIYSGEEEK